MPNSVHKLIPMEFQYTKQTLPVRVEVIEGEPWFAAKDVCDILEIANNRDAISRLDDDEKGVVATDTPGGVQQLQFVNESGLYNLIFQSRKPSAKKFRKWVTAEVLPAIRKTGGYGRPAASAAPVVANLMNGEAIGELLQYCDKREHEGQTYYAAVQLRKLFGRYERTGSTTRVLHELEASGDALKLPPNEVNAKWWVTRRAIPRLLSIRPTNLLNISIIKTLTEGGAQ